MNKPKPTLLLMSGGCLTGQNVLASMEGRRDSITLCALNSCAAEPANFCFDHVRLVPEIRADTVRFSEKFDEALNDLNPDLIVPCRDDDVQFLAERRERCAMLKSSALCGDIDVAFALLNKHASFKFSVRHGLPFAKTISCKEAPAAITEFADANGYPLVCKPAAGFASKGISFLMNRAQLEAKIGAKDLILQAFIGCPDPLSQYLQVCAKHGIPLFNSFEATKISIQVYITRSGKIGRPFVTANTMRNGKSELVEKVEDDEALLIGRKCAVAFGVAGWRGPLNIQCQRTQDGELLIYEYNGRFTGATSARRLLGYDEVGIAIHDYCSGADVERALDPVLSVKRRLVSSKLDFSSVEKLTEEGVWDGE